MSSFVLMDGCVLVRTVGCSFSCFLFLLGEQTEVSRELERYCFPSLRCMNQTLLGVHISKIEKRVRC